MATSPDIRVRALLDRFGAPDASPAALLCDDRPPDGVAFRIVDADLATTTLTYAELRSASERFASGLATIGVRPGDRVASLMAKSADLVVAIMGIWRLGAVHVPLFTAFAPSAIEMRLRASGARVVVCDSTQLPKLDSIRQCCRVVVAGEARGDLAFDDLLSAQPFEVPAVVGGDAPIIEIFTSGTTGSPKAVVCPVRALAGFCAYLEFGLDVRADDVYWNAADPGWAYGLYYGIAGPLACGRPNILVSSGFSPQLTWQVLAELEVTNFTAAPTVYRALQRQADQRAVPALPLRRLSSAGEALTPDVISWAQRTFGIPVRDHYGQTEQGMVIANAWHPKLTRPVRPGSMGHALPGWSATVLENDSDRLAPVGVAGRLALDTKNSPLMTFQGYRDAPDRSAERFLAGGRWYLTGDVAARDQDGCFQFAARDDDIILMAGYRIGPFEVESTLIQHPHVTEAAAVGVPDELRGEVLEAFVVLADGAAAGEALEHELQEWVKTRYAAHAYPRRVHFVDQLPKTPSGKVQRHLLRQRRREDAALR